MDQTEKKPTRRSGLKEIRGRNISIRLPLDLYDRIDSEWDKKGFKSKTDMVENICKEYFKSIECPMCGTLNPPKAIRCAVCGKELIDITSKRKELRNINEVFYEKLRTFTDIYIEIQEYHVVSIENKITNEIKLDFQNQELKLSPIFDSLFSVVEYVVISIERAIRMYIVLYHLPKGLYCACYDDIDICNIYGDYVESRTSMMDIIKEIKLPVSDMELDRIIDARIQQGEDVFQAINSEIERKRKGIEQLSIDIEISRHLLESIKDIYKEIMEK